MIESTCKPRCQWVTQDSLYIDYHDKEWWIEIHDSYKLFELLCLEWQQAGLSWITILKRRTGMRKIYDEFIPEKLVEWTDSQINSAIKDTKVIRHRLKVIAIIKNAEAYLKLTKKDIDFSMWIWSYAPSSPRDYTETYRTQSPESIALSKALKEIGFSFCGPTICYAFMQACGMVDGHSPWCWKFKRWNS